MVTVAGCEWMTGNRERNFNCGWRSLTIKVELLLASSSGAENIGRIHLWRDLWPHSIHTVRDDFRPAFCARLRLSHTNIHSKIILFYLSGPTRAQTAPLTSWNMDESFKSRIKPGSLAAASCWQSDEPTICFFLFLFRNIRISSSSLHVHSVFSTVSILKTKKQHVQSVHMVHYKFSSQSFFSETLGVWRP